MIVKLTSLFFLCTAIFMASALLSRSRVKTILRISVVVFACIMVVFSGCNMVDVYDNDIRKASHDIKTAKNVADQATAYSNRGRGYSDKARLSLVRNLITPDEYRRLFSLAINDHDQSLALDPGNAEMYFRRGLSYYDRAALANEPVADHKPWFDAARVDFEKASDKDPRHSMAYDYLGLIDEQTGRIEQAIIDYTREMELDPRGGKSRLAEVYCTRGRSYLGQKQYDLAASDFEKSIEFVGNMDGCSCGPYNPLAYIYIDVQRKYDKGWELIRRTQGTRNAIASEYIERLKKSSGRQTL